MQAESSEKSKQRDASRALQMAPSADASSAASSSAASIPRRIPRSALLSPDAACLLFIHRSSRRLPLNEYAFLLQHHPNLRLHMCAWPADNRDRIPSAKDAAASSDNGNSNPVQPSILLHGILSSPSPAVLSLPMLQLLLQEQAAEQLAIRDDTDCIALQYLCCRDDWRPPGAVDLLLRSMHECGMGVADLLWIARSLFGLVRSDATPSLEEIAAFRQYYAAAFLQRPEADTLLFVCCSHISPASHDVAAPIPEAQMQILRVVAEAHPADLLQVLWLFEGCLLGQLLELCFELLPAEQWMAARDEIGDNVLHWICRCCGENRADGSLLPLLQRALSQGARQLASEPRDQLQQFPLHHLIANPAASLEALQLLAEASPLQALITKNEHGRVAMHAACKLQSEDLRTAVRAAAAAEEAAKQRQAQEKGENEKEHAGQAQSAASSLHLEQPLSLPPAATAPLLAAEAALRLTLLTDLLALAPECTAVADDDDLLPLDALIRNERCTSAHLRLMWNATPELLRLCASEELSCATQDPSDVPDYYEPLSRLRGVLVRLHRAARTQSPYDQELLRTAHELWTDALRRMMAVAGAREEEELQEMEPEESKDADDESSASEDTLPAKLANGHIPFDFGLLQCYTAEKSLTDQLDELMLQLIVCADGTESDRGEAADALPSQRQLSASAHWLLQVADECGRTAFLRYLAASPQDLPLSSELLRWFCRYAPFVFRQSHPQPQSFRGHIDGSTSGRALKRQRWPASALALLGGREDVTPHMLEEVLEATHKHFVEQCEGAAAAAASLGISAVDSEVEQEEDCEAPQQNESMPPPPSMLHPLLQRDEKQCLPVEHLLLARSAAASKDVAAADHLLALLRVMLRHNAVAQLCGEDISPNQCVHRPLHTYIEAAEQRDMRILQLLSGVDAIDHVANHPAGAANEANPPHLVARMWSLQGAQGSAFAQLIQAEPLITPAELSWLAPLRLPEWMRGLRTLCTQQRLDDATTTLELLRHVMQLEPQVLAQGNVEDSGFTVLHTQCMIGAAPELLSSIVELCKPMIDLREARDRNGELALHCYAYRYASERSSISITDFDQFARMHRPELLLLPATPAHSGAGWSPLSKFFLSGGELHLEDACCAARLAMTVPTLSMRQAHDEYMWTFLMPMLIQGMEEARRKGAEDPEAAQIAFLNELTEGAVPAARAVFLRALYSCALLQMPSARSSALCLRPPHLLREKCDFWRLTQWYRYQSNDDAVYSSVHPATIGGWMKKQLGRKHTNGRCNFIVDAIDDMAAPDTSAEARRAAQLAECLRKYAQISRTLSTRSDAALLRVANPLCASPSQPVAHSWNGDLTNNPRALEIVMACFFTLLRAKARIILSALLRRLHAQNIHVATWSCPSSGSSPLHVLVGELRGCRTKLFHVLMRDALAAHGGSLEAVLSSQDAEGKPLRTLLAKRHNREMMTDVELMAADAKAAPETTASAVPVQHLTVMQAPTQSHAAAAEGVAVAAASGPSAAMPFSRRNFVTFDRVVSIDLERHLDGASVMCDADVSSSSAARATDRPHPMLLPQNATAAELAVYSMDHLLSADECRRLIAATSAQDSLAGEYLREDRDSTRLLCRSDGLARALFSRLEGIISQIHRDHPDRKPMGFCTFGRWEPFALNSCFRFSEYRAGSGGFAPHRDANFVEAPDVRSIFTLLIYLTDSDSEGEEEQKSFGEMRGSPAACASYGSINGATTFFLPTALVKEGLIADESPRAVMSVRPVAGRALLFPHELIHSGGPLAAMAQSSKCVMRTDLMYRRRTAVPLTPMERNWRNDADYLRSVELFQLAFKHELAGRLKESAECYTRCSALRAWPLLQQRQRQQQLSSSSPIDLPPALHMASDCLRVILRFLDSKSALAVACCSQRWWALMPQRTHKMPELKDIGSQLVAYMQTSKPLALRMEGEPSKQKQRLRSLLPRWLTQTHPSAPDPVLRILPCLREVGGIVCVMSYPRAFYSRYAPRCRRVMAVYAALTLSHHLPCAVSEPDDHNGRVNAKTAAFLLATRCVLSYQSCPASSDDARVVEWAIFADILRGTFAGEDVAVRRSSLEEFNRDDFAVASSASLRHSYAFGESFVKAAATTHLRHCISFAGLLPSFYHAGHCCKQYFTGGPRHELSCYDQRDMVAAKRKKQAEARRQQLRHNAQELSAVDQGLVTSAVEASDASASSSAAGSSVSSSLLSQQLQSPTRVVVQEMKGTRKEAHFRVSFIGVACM